MDTMQLLIGLPCAVAYIAGGHWWSRLASAKYRREHPPQWSPPNWDYPIPGEGDALRAELEECRRLRTLGGVPPPIDMNWANGTLPPPPSASDPAAPTHRRDQEAGDAG